MAELHPSAAEVCGIPRLGLPPYPEEVGGTPAVKSLGQERLEGQVQQELLITGRMASVNELLRNRYLAIKEKKRWHQKIALLARAQGFRPVTNARFWFWVTEPDKRRDPDGFCFVASKTILDGLQHAGLLEGDGWNCNRGMTFNWYVGDPMIRVLVIGEPWEESENERRAKGKAKFQRKVGVGQGNRRHQRHPTLGGAPPGAPKGSCAAVRVTGRGK